ncbi:MAG: D-amino acid dehydrogenase [Dongiaceae bacterium]
MTTVVLGAGVVGVTTAYRLAKEGDRVILVDRQPGAALETSFANGGLVTPGMSDPWAAPGVPKVMLTHLGREDSPILLRLRALPGMLGWGLAFLANCRPATWRRNTESVLRLAVHSRDALTAITAETGLRYDRCDQGNLRIYRDPVAFAKAAKAAAMYRELGQDVRQLDPAAALALEPALGPVGGEIAGGIHYADDHSGDCHVFTQGLAKAAAGLGVEFRTGVSATGFEVSGGRVAALATSAGRIAGDRFVLAAGSYSTALARSLGFALPVRPCKGYAATIEAGGWNKAPKIPVCDYDRKMAVTPLGTRIRLAGTAEFAGFDLAPNQARSAMLLEGFRLLFPEFPGGPTQFWHGLRPLCPDGRPVVGRSPIANLYINAGHGPLGWTLSCGSADLLADLMAGRTPAVPAADFALERFR